MASVEFAVVDTVTGKVLRTGQCPDSALAIQGRGVNEKVIEGKYSDLDWRYDTSSKQIVAAPEVRLAYEQAKAADDAAETAEFAADQKALEDIVADAAEPQSNRKLASILLKRT